MFYFWGFEAEKESIIEIIQSPEEMQARSDRVRREDKTIVLVPTMGYLHEGHLSLMRKGIELGDDLVVSIFVNPTQFGPGEDLGTYPRDFERDVELARKEGVNVIFAPREQDIYGERYQTYVSLEHLPLHLCGISRPVHFRGVATVVAKLFNIVKPHVAVFGKKDYQQFVVLRRLAEDLNFGIEVVGAPIVREPDGLAMSSRNAYLNAEQRFQALCLYAALQKAGESVRGGEKDARKIIDRAAALIGSHPEARIDYIAVCDPETLEDVKWIERPALLALAVKIGSTRLIDNKILTPNP